MAKFNEHKAFMKKYLKLYEEGKSQRISLSDYDGKMVKELITLRYLNIETFKVFDTGNAGSIYSYTGGYPFTPEGKVYYEMGWYQVVNKRSWYQLTRDIAAFVGFIAGLIFTVINILKLLNQ